MTKKETYVYAKLRRDFGRQPMFTETPPMILDSIEPDKKEAKNYFIRNPVHQESQVSLPKSECYINTTKIELQNRGINHVEGGWPKETNYNDEEATLRHCRRIERDDAYVNTVQDTAPRLQKCILQNNAIEMYENYYAGMKPFDSIEKPHIMLNNVYKDQTGSRPVASIDWTVGNDSKMVVAYCNKKYTVTAPVKSDLTCNIWNVEKTIPIFKLLPPVPCWQIACSPISSEIMIGGLEDGRVCIFDMRHKEKPVLIEADKVEVKEASPHYMAHRAPIAALIYFESRMNNEFFSGSSDGRCIWYDIRNISEPINSLIMSVKIPIGETVSLANAEGVSALQYERAFPTRFLCGTDTGLIINVNRKGRSHNEVMSAVYKSHTGPVKALHRNPSAIKYFITCGDWKVNIWADDIKTDPIIAGSEQRYQIQDVAWAPQRASGYMTVTSQGKFHYWDLLRSYQKSIATLKLSKYPLLKLKPHESGQLVVVGDSMGVLYLMSLSYCLAVSGPSDKQLLSQMLERESRRERILEARVKEIRVKQKTVTEDVLTTPGGEVVDEVTFIKQVEDEYRQGVLKEIRRGDYQIPTTPARTR